jgi:hypothetical protein
VCLRVTCFYKVSCCESVGVFLGVKCIYWSFVVSGRKVKNTTMSGNKEELMDQVKAQIALVNAQELISVSDAMQCKLKKERFEIFQSSHDLS